MREEALIRLAVEKIERLLRLSAKNAETGGKRMFYRGCRGLLPLLLLALGAAPASGQQADAAALSLEDLLDVTVTGAAKYSQKQSEVAAAASVITRDEIKAFGWRTLDEALSSLPGIHSSYDRQYSGIGTRGIGLPGDYLTRVLVAVNGNRLNDALYDAGSVGRDFPIDIDLIERIEFISGPGGAVYGQNAMFGVVNIITRDGASLDGGEASVAWMNRGNQREARISWGRRLENGVDALFSVSGLRADGQTLSMVYPGAGPGGSDVGGRVAGQDGERDGEFFARVAGGAWSAEIASGKRRKDDPTAAFFAEPMVDGQYQRDAYSLMQVQYRQRHFDDQLEVLARVFSGRQRYDAIFSYAGRPNRARGESDWHGGELRLLHTGIAGHKLLFGGEWQRNSRILQSNDDPGTAGIDTLIRGDGQRHGIYFQDEWRFAEAWTSILGLRADRSTVGDTQISPRLGLIWQAAPATTLKMLYGRAHRAPNAYERDYDDSVTQVANPDLSSETVDTYELVADHRLGNGTSLRASFYRWRLSDIAALTSDPVSGLTQYRSGERIDAEGVELSAARRWSSGVSLRGSLAFQDVTYQGGNELENSPRWLGRLNLIYPLPWHGLRLGYEYRFEGSRRTLAGAELGAYSLSHLNLSAEGWIRGVDLSLAVRNLFDRHYHHPGADTNWQDSFAQDGRAVLLKMDYRF
jgi:iron complex outermembrane receptor protein